MEMQNGTHIELRPRAIGDMMGKIPAKLGLTALLYFSLVIVLFVYFTTSFRVRNSMQVPISVSGVSKSVSLTAQIPERQALKIKTGQEITVVLPSLPGKSRGVEARARITGISGEKGGIYTASMEPLEQTEAIQQYTQQARAAQGEMIMGSHSVLRLFFGE
jgi:hypothetical protein